MITKINTRFQPDAPEWCIRHIKARPTSPILLIVPSKRVKLYLVTRPSLLTMAARPPISNLIRLTSHSRAVIPRAYTHLTCNNYPRLLRRSLQTTSTSQHSPDFAFAFEYVRPPSRTLYTSSRPPASMASLSAAPTRSHVRTKPFPTSSPNVSPSFSSPMAAGSTSQSESRN